MVKDAGTEDVGVVDVATEDVGVVDEATVDVGVKMGAGIPSLKARATERHLPAAPTILPAAPTIQFTIADCQERERLGQITAISGGNRLL